MLSSLRQLLFAAAAAASTAPAQQPQNHDWPVYLGDKATTHYPTLKQINKENVGRLREVWNHDTGEKGELQSNGLAIGGVLYTATTNRKVLALDAATGQHRWTFDPAELRPGNQGRRQRGVTYWASGSDRRIFTGAGPYLYAVNAANGKIIRSFGTEGSSRRGDRDARRTGAEPDRQHARHDLQRHVHRGRQHQWPGGDSRLRRAHRALAVDLSSDSAARRIRLSFLAARGVQDRGRRVQLVRPFAR
jgi:hypothetical protein